MHYDHAVFVRAIKDNRKVKLVFLTDAAGTKVEKLCGPMLYSPPIAGDESDCYYFWDFESGSGKQFLGFPSNKIVSMELTEQAFDPAELITSGLDYLKVKRKKQSGKTIRKGRS